MGGGLVFRPSCGGWGQKIKETLTLDDEDNDDDDDDWFGQDSFFLSLFLLTYYFHSTLFTTAQGGSRCVQVSACAVVQICSDVGNGGHVSPSCASNKSL